MRPAWLSLLALAAFAACPPRIYGALPDLAPEEAALLPELSAGLARACRGLPSGAEGELPSKVHDLLQRHLGPHAADPAQRTTFLTRLGRAARYLDSFLEVELPVRSPYPSSIAPLTVEPPPPECLPFAPGANLAVTLSYPALPGFQLRLRGASFRYRPGTFPDLVLEPERLKLESSVQNLLKTAPGSDTLPLGRLPVRLVEPVFSGLNGGLAVRFGVVVDLGEVVGVAGKGQLTVRATASVKPGADRLTWSGKFEGTVPLRLPLGHTGVMLHGGKVGLDLEAREVTLGTTLVPAAGGEAGLALAVSVSVRLPHKGQPARIKFEGDLEAGHGKVKVGKVEGTWSGREVTGTLTLPHPAAGVVPLRLAGLQKAGFRLGEQGLEATCTLCFFERITARGRLTLQPDGQGAFEAVGVSHLFATELSGQLEVTFAPGFRDLELVAALSVDVPVPGLEDVHAQVEVRASAGGVQVAACGAGQDFLFRVPSLDFDLRGELAGRFQRARERIIQAVAAGVSSLGGGERVSALKGRLALLDPRHPDGLRAQLEGAQLCACALGKPETLTGSTLAELRRLELALPFRPLRPPLALLSGEGERPLPARLARFVSALPQLGDIGLSPPPARVRSLSGARVRSTTLYLSFRHALAGPLPQEDGAEVWVLVECSGRTSTARPDDPRSSSHKAGSELAWLRLELGDLAGRHGRPSAILELPHGLGRGGYTTLPVDRVVRDVVQGLLERYLPEVRLLGTQRFYEKELAVRNATGRTQVVSVVLHRQALEEDGYHWGWDGPFRLVVATGKTEVVQRPVQVRLPGVWRWSGPWVGVPVSGSRARVWAESAGGKIEEFRDRDLWLVEPSATLAGERVYQGAHVGRYTHLLRER